MTTEDFLNKPVGELTTAEIETIYQQSKEKKEKDRQAYKELVNDIIPYLVERLKNVSDLLSREKGTVYLSLIEALKIKLSIYNTKSDNQTHTFSTDDGCSITIGYRVIDGWDDTVNAGLAKINEFIGTLSKDEETAKLVKAINRLLKKDSKGDLKANRVIELQALADDFNNEIFTDGVDIIRKSYRPIRSAFFLEAQYLDASGIKQTIPLSITSVNFPPDIDFTFLFTNQKIT